MSNTHEAQSEMTKQDTLPPLEQERAAFEALADEYASAAAKARMEAIYGTSKSYTRECQREENEARAALMEWRARAALAAQAPQQAQGVATLPENETPAMHDAVMAVLYKDGATRTNTNALWRAYRGALAAAPQAAPAPQALAPLTDAQIEKLREQTFSTSNPFCPCDSKTMRKAVWAAERAHGIGASAGSEG